MAGQQWFGQLEARIQQTIAELAASKKLIWYIPDMLQLARSGTHPAAASILDQILPAHHLRPPDRVDRGDGDEHGPPRAVAAAAARAHRRSCGSSRRARRRRSDLADAFVARLAEEAGLEIDAGCVPVAISSARRLSQRLELPRLRYGPHQADRIPRPQEQQEVKSRRKR